jgi:hypothetical protein
VNLPCEFDDSGIIIEMLRSIDRGGPQSGPLWPCSLPEAKSSARISVAAAIYVCRLYCEGGAGRAAWRPSRAGETMAAGSANTH